MRRRSMAPPASSPAVAGSDCATSSETTTRTRGLPVSHESSPSLIELGMASPTDGPGHQPSGIKMDGRSALNPMAELVMHSLASSAAEQALRDESELLRALINLGDFGIVLLDLAGKVAFVNRHAQTMFDAGAVIKLQRDRIHCNINGIRQSFDQALEAQCEAARNCRAVSPFALRIPHSDGHGLAFIKIQRLTAADDVDAAQGIAVFVFDAARQHPQRQHSLCELYGLSTTEAKVATLLAAGCDITDIANRMNIAKNTVRAHLRSAFVKTGTKKQAQLVARLCRDLLALESLLR